MNLWTYVHFMLWEKYSYCCFLIHSRSNFDLPFLSNFQDKNLSLDVSGNINTRVTCTACFQQIILRKPGTAWRHPLLRVLLCKVGLLWGSTYGSGAVCLCPVPRKPCCLELSLLIATKTAYGLCSQSVCPFSMMCWLLASWMCQHCGVITVTFLLRGMGFIF